MDIGSCSHCRHPSSKLRSSVAHTHPQHPSHQNLRAAKLSGLPVPKVRHYMLMLIMFSTLKPFLCQSPTASPAPGLPQASAASSSIQGTLQCMQLRLYKWEEQVMGIALLYPPWGWNTHPALNAFVLSIFGFFICLGNTNCSAFEGWAALSLLSFFCFLNSEYQTAVYTVPNRAWDEDSVGHFTFCVGLWDSTD